MSLYSFAIVIMFATVVCSVGKSNAALVCRCVVKNSQHLRGRCLVALPCTNQLPLLGSNRRLRNKPLLAFKNKLYHAYGAVGNQKCIVRGTFYNNKFNLCIKLVKCLHKVWGIPDGPVTKFYYALNNKLYRSYPPACY